MQDYMINLIPGDGIGVDVINEAVRVMDTLSAKDGGVKFSCNLLEWSCQYHLKNEFELQMSVAIQLQPR